jgi:hypothetical protein
MSKGNTFENDWLRLIFNNVDIATIGDAGGVRGSVAAGSLFVSLHSGDVGEAGTQSTSEVAYTSYARVAVARTTAGWTVTNNTVVNNGEIAFPQCTGGSASATHFAVGTAASGTGKVLYKGALGASLAISNNITPKFEASALTITEE